MIAGEDPKFSRAQRDSILSRRSLAIVLDHLIIAGAKVVSLAERGVL